MAERTQPGSSDSADQPVLNALTDASPSAAPTDTPNAASPRKDGRSLSQIARVAAIGSMIDLLEARLADARLAESNGQRTGATADVHSLQVAINQAREQFDSERAKLILRVDPSQESPLRPHLIGRQPHTANPAGTTPQARESDPLPPESVEVLEILSWNTERELTRRQLQDAWETLKRKQERWLSRKRRERAALRVRRDDLAEAERQIAMAREKAESELKLAEGTKEQLEEELAGLNVRIENQRALLSQTESSGEGPAPAPIGAPREIPEDVARNSAELDRLRADLLDQSLLTAELAEQLLRAKADWEKQRDQFLSELESATRELLARDARSADRERRTLSAEARLREKEAELRDLQRELALWRARLHGDELLLRQQAESTVETQNARQASLDRQWADLQLAWENFRRTAEGEHSPHADSSRREVELQRQIASLRAELTAQEAGRRQAELRAEAMMEQVNLMTVEALMEDPPAPRLFDRAA